MDRSIKDISDIRAIEAAGFDAFLPDKTPYDLIRSSASRHPDNTAIRYIANVEEPARTVDISYQDLLSRIHQAANAFRRCGVDTAGSVAILVPNSPGGQIALWGAQLAGRACPINPMLRPRHVGELIEAAGAKAVVVLGENAETTHWETLVPSLKEAGVKLPILDCEGDRQSRDSDGCFETLCARENADGLDFEIDGDEHTTAALYHTGGTTGLPKLVRHRRLSEAHVARSAALMYDLRATDVVANGFPIFHVAGAFVYGLSALSVGATQLIPGRLGMRNTGFVGSIWKQVERHGITVIGGVPTVLSAFNGIPVDADIAKLRLMLTGGSPLPTDLADAFEQNTGKPVRNIFGMTESAGCIAIEPARAKRVPNSCGFPLPFSRAAVRAPGAASANNEQSRGTTGVLVVRGPNISPGYSNPDLDAGTFDDDGWLISGDLGHIDGSGRVFITGRAKDVIIRGAHNLDPQLIEDAFLSHADVVDAAAVGMPDSYAGELPVVFVTVRPASRASQDELLAYAAANISEPAALSKRVATLDSMPLTPIGKIYKPALRKIAIGWAVTNAAASCGLTTADYTLAVDDKLECRIESDELALQDLRKALTGMPLQVTFTCR